MSKIIGINAYHGDSSACLIIDGKLIAAVEEERFKRIKHWAGFPAESILFCLKEGKLKLSDIDHIAINSNPNANFFRKVLFTLRNRPDVNLILDKIKNKNARLNIQDELSKAFSDQKFEGQIHKIEHHLSHIGSAHLVSPFQDSASLSVDGFGDFSSGAWGMCRGVDINIDKRIYFPHSLGTFYQAMTQFIGFPHYGDEYKVMGLAPYGKPTFLDKLQELVKLKNDGTYELNLKYFKHHTEKTSYEWEGGSPQFDSLYKKDEMEELFGFSVKGKKDILNDPHIVNFAHSVQAMYEKAFFNILKELRKNYDCDNLTLAGGCAYNSVANGKIYRNSTFKNVYIQSASGDAGGAIGAAYVVSKNIGELKKPIFMDHAYWGPSYSNENIKELLKTRKKEIENAGCNIEEVTDEDALCEKTAQSISDGKVIGWFQGKMEWGPRALGNRSILGDPRRSDMKDILNIKIKRRESFRPFAPSILREHVSDWFEEDDNVPFMMKVFQVRKDKRDIISAVTHVDGSGRLQTVSSSTNSRYHKLISKFQEITNVPVLLNTSFNENEPVVCKPEEALATFLRTKMDLLVLGNWCIERQSEIIKD